MAYDIALMVAFIGVAAVLVYISTTLDSKEHKAFLLLKPLFILVALWVLWSGTIAQVHIIDYANYSSSTAFNATTYNGLTTTVVNTGQGIYYVTFFGIAFYLCYLIYLFIIPMLPWMVQKLSGRPLGKRRIRTRGGPWR